MSHFEFYSNITAFTHFDDVVDNKAYVPVPDDWFVALTDIKDSTKAIENGQYKAVNMAGAAGISAILNELDHADFPFVFGGDGCTLLLPSSALDVTRNTLASTACWAQETIGLTLRTAIIPISMIRKAGHDVRVARYAPSPHLSYAMLAGGGVGWAEVEMKQGRYIIDAAAPGMYPDLEGLSCRWTPMRAKQGVIASLIVCPHGDATQFSNLVSKIVDLLDTGAQHGSPVPEEGPEAGFTKTGYALDMFVRKASPKPLIGIVKLWFELGMVWILTRTRGVFRGFDLPRYRRVMAANSDFRKFDDALRMTVDIEKQRLESLRSLLEEAQASGICRYGIHTQNEALMTCIVPSVVRDDHLHFIDGGGGGYALAAQQIKNN